MIYISQNSLIVYTLYYFSFSYYRYDYTVQQILDDWMLWIIEYNVFMFFGPQNPKIILKFIG